MALSTKTLENDLKLLFSNMKNAGVMVKDSDFADGIAKACKDFGESGDISTTDGGTISGGVFTGSGTGSISLEASLMASVILTACTTMKSITSGGDSILATAIGNGIQAMVSAGQVSTDVTGTLTPPSPSPTIPYSGKANGKLTCVNTSLINGLNAVFIAMKNRRNEKDFNGDNYFAEQLANLVNDYFTSGTVATNGIANLTGSVGSGTIS